MDSIDKLREWANGLHGVYINRVDHTITLTTDWDAPPDMDSVSLRDHFNGFLDAIEREVEELRDRDYRSCVEDGEMAAERDGWVRLPVDADGVPIHVGDVLDGYGKTIEVVELRYGRSGWVLISRDGNGYADCAAFSHHHAPTVEDVLREFVDALDIDRCDDPDATIAEFAAKLALRGDE